MYFDLLNHDSYQIDLPLSPYNKFYTKFTPLHPEDYPQLIIQTERERLQTFYSKNALPQKEVWSRKRITKISEFGWEILTMFELNDVLFRYHMFQNKPIQCTISDAEFPPINPNDILTIVAHFRSHQVDDLSMGAYDVTLSFLKDYVVEFRRCDFELAHLFRTEKHLAKIDFKLPKVEILAEGFIDELVLEFVHLQRKINKRDFFHVLDKHLVPTKALRKFINRASKSEEPEHVKAKFISQLQWYIEVRDWLYQAYVFIKEKSN